VESKTQEELKVVPRTLTPGIPLKSEKNSMKTTLFVLCFFCATAAFGQASMSATALSNEPQVTQFVSHLGHASQVGMGQVQNVMEQSFSVQAHGVRPLWEFAVPAQVTPLGDSARLLRKDHATAKKAEIVWTN
jgi:hypothetical protein